jgi:hypothetical protein
MTDSRVFDDICFMPVPVFKYRESGIADEDEKQCASGIWIPVGVTAMRFAMTISKRRGESVLAAS